jgi:hypothetical protein
MIRSNHSLRAIRAQRAMSTIVQQNNVASIGVNSARKFGLNH